jgi:hypothetical protein
MFRHTGYENLFKYHSGRVVAKRALTSQSRRKHGLITFVQGLVSQMVKQDHLLKRRYKRTRAEYTNAICQGFMAIDPVILREYLTRQKYVKDDAVESGSVTAFLPAVAAILNHRDMMSKIVVGHTHLILSGSEYFSNAIDAAVALGHTNMLSVVLEMIKRSARGRREAGSWDEMRTAARAIGKSLRTAIRLHEYDAARMIFKFLFENPM